MKEKQLTLGSLFDGSGGFPLAAQMCDIKTLWASEIEPFPILVTRKQFPDMEHKGDICKLNGADLEPVDIISFGSPCTNLANCGDRKGLAGTQSRLFFEAIRVIKEMREATNGQYPKYIIFENVSNALSSNKGADFRIILEQICSIKEADVSIPEFTERKWLNAGEIMGDTYSVAWRLLSAQYWGVPQNRKRIFLVADFTDRRGAGEILFESEGLSRYSAENFRSWKDCTRNFENSPDQTGRLKLFENHSQDRRYSGPYSIAPTVTQKFGSGGNTQPLVVKEEPTYCMTWTKHTSITKETAPTLLSRDYKNPMVVNDKKGQDWYVRKLTPLECCRLQGFPDWWCKDVEIENPDSEELEFWRHVFLEKARIDGKSLKPKTDKQIAKWLKGPHSDAAEYRMWGNGVALPCVWFVMAGIEYWDGIKA